MRKMHPDLVRAPRFQFAFNQCCCPQLLAKGNAGNRMAPIRDPHGHLLAVGSGSANRRFDPYPSRLETGAGQARKPRIAVLWFAPNERIIEPVDGMGRELLRQAMMCRVGFCDHQQAGCILVDPMYDARPLFSSDTGQTIPAMVQQGIDQRTRPLAGGRMNDHPGGLVDHDQMSILVHDRQGNCLWLWNRVDGWRYMNRKGRSPRYLHGWIGVRDAAGVGNHCPRFDKGAQTRPADAMRLA